MITYLENLALDLADKIAHFLAKNRVQPVHVTLARFLIATPVSLYFFSRGTYVSNILGLFFYMIIAILDWVDGKLARLMKLGKETKPLGKFVDYTLDRMLMLIVLGSIFYAGLHSTQGNVWMMLVVVYFTIFFFLTTLLYEFDSTFNVTFKEYPQIEKRMHEIQKTPKIMDKFLYNLINVHNNSITKFCFSVSYPLFIGIILNQLIATFIFITFMLILRSSAISWIMYDSLKKNQSNLSLIKVLRKHMKTHA